MAPIQRLSGPEASALSRAQQSVYDAIVSGPRGAIGGPLEIWLHSPELASRAQQLGEFCRYGAALEVRLRELAILVTASYWRAGYEWTAHAPLALDAGVAPTVVEAVRQGSKPSFTLPDESIVYAFATELLQNHRISETTYRQAVDVLGETSVVDLVGILGYYALISMTIVAFEVASGRNEDPFAN